ncbi:hypothetical protein EIP91_007292 [Steccherinum ochraceum]|uniref:AMP-dependent synthetase/ligase domain-containing protein n=1 Tax=Steccherinum ochraceum TaxID=92696 RepID=A0A4R0R4B2_9APHY|nr:hypothetical protein EIP91_007292 [Steccherinum ochraceum]
MTSVPKSPPRDGSLYVLPGFMDFHAEHAPNNSWVTFPSREDPTKSASVSYQEGVEATHRVAHALRPGRTGPEQEVVAMLLNCDSIMYNATMIGMFRAGIVPFPMSPKNSPEAVCHMLRTTKCHRVLSQPSLSALTSAVKATLEEEGHSVQLEELPAFHDIFPTLVSRQVNGDAHVEPYPARNPPRGMDDLVIYIHSSGSTGLPKSIPWTERILLTWADSSIVRMSCKYQLRWAVQALPPFHSIGMVGHMLVPLVSGLPVAHFTPQAPAPPVLPNPQNMIEGCRITGCNAMSAVPIFIEMWCRSPDLVDYLAGMECLTWAGGPLSASNGDMLVSKGVNLAMIYGTTEIGVVNRVMDLDFSENPRPDCKRPEDWAWMQMDERIQPRWIDQGDGTYELQCLARLPYVFGE